jgi:DNA primase
MSHFEQGVIDEIKSFPLAAFLERDGLALKSQGKDLLAHCPFHQDKTPSFVVSPDKNLWHCLGACGVGGSIIDYVMQRDAVGFKKAVEVLQETQIRPQSTMSMPQDDIADFDICHTEPQAWLQHAIKLYHDNLVTNPNALAYLESRGLNHPDLIKTFQLGYSAKNLGSILPSRASKEGKQVRELVRQIGLTTERGLERFSGSIVVPVINSAQVLEIYGRKTAPANKLRSGTPLHLYLPRKHQGVWNLDSLANQNAVILCESLIDAMTFWAHGFKYVTCSYGVNGFTESHLHAFKNKGIKRVLIAYDRDAAGDKALFSLAALLKENGLEAWQVKLPPGLDVNEFALQSSEPKDALNTVLLQAKPINNESEFVNKTEAGAATPEPENQLKITDNDVRLTLGERQYRIKGLDKNKTPEQLKINLMLRHHDAMHVDAIDLYHAKQRKQFIEQAAAECDVEARVLKSDLGTLLLKLEALQDQEATQDKQETIELSQAEKDEAFALLQNPQLLKQVLIDFEHMGVIGEDSNKLVGYLACTSRKLDKPLAVLIQSSSSAGKSSLMDSILRLMPTEEALEFSAMTGQSLFYMSDSSLKHKILAISEEEGITQAAYALKILQSAGELTMASTGKDPITGQLVTQEYKTEGPVALFMTTTSIDIDEELLNRCLVLTVNESREQTQAIHRQQRKRRTLDGLLQKVAQDKLVTLHQNAQRLLRTLYVVNPFAEQLSFLDHQTRTRRDHEKYLTLIESIALLHQYQRPVRTIEHMGKHIEYIEVTPSDIEQANALANETLGRTLDELPAQTRKLLEMIYEWGHIVADSQGIDLDDCRFTRKQLRDSFGWSDTALKVHLARLVELEYIVTHKQGHKQRLHYELLYRGEQGDSFMLKLKQVDGNRSGQSTNPSGSGQPVVSVQSDSGLPHQNGFKSNDSNGFVLPSITNNDKAHLGEKLTGRQHA